MTRGSWTRRLESEVLKGSLKVIMDNKAFSTMVMQSLNENTAKMEDVEAVNRRVVNSTSMLEQMNNRFDILNATLIKETKSFYNTLNSDFAIMANSSYEFLLRIDALKRSNDILNATYVEQTKLFNNTLKTHFAVMTDASDDFLAEIDVLKRRNAAMEQSIVLHTKIMYSCIGSITILLVFCLIFAVFRSCRSRSHSVHDTSSTYQLSLETDEITRGYEEFPQESMSSAPWSPYEVTLWFIHI